MILLLIIILFLLLGLIGFTQLVAQIMKHEKKMR
jgi:hypothetical protein